MNLNIPKIKADKYFFFYVVIGLILFAILSFTVFLATRGLPSASDQTTQTTPTSIPSTGQDPEIITIELDKVIPDEPAGLTSGLPHSFYVYFKKPITLDLVDFSVTYTYFYRDDTLLKPVQIEKKLLGQSTVELRTVDLIQQGAEYQVHVKDKKTNKLISMTRYSSLNLVPTPIKNNNLSLIPSLPHTTDSFVLEYLQERNIYIFHFIYNSSSSLSLNQQFENAKAAALQFIQSKGIDPSTIVIEWRYS